LKRRKERKFTLEARCGMKKEKKEREKEVRRWHIKKIHFWFTVTV
jgi:hypothetical protein